MYAQTPVPDARRSDPSTYGEEVAALIRIIREQCPSPTGKRPTMQQVGDLIGLSDSILYQYVGPKRRRRPIAIPFPVVFALRVLVSALPATRAALWPAHG